MLLQPGAYLKGLVSWSLFSLIRHSGCHQVAARVLATAAATPFQDKGPGFVIPLNNCLDGKDHVVVASKSLGSSGANRSRMSTASDRKLNVYFLSPYARFVLQEAVRSGFLQRKAYTFCCNCTISARAICKSASIPYVEPQEPSAENHGFLLSQGW